MTGVHPLGRPRPARRRRRGDHPADRGDRRRPRLPRRHARPDGFAARFPTVYAACRGAGVDPAREPIPVRPAAHYSCGGVVTDPHGRTGGARALRGGGGGAHRPARGQPARVEQPARGPRRGSPRGRRRRAGARRPAAARRAHGDPLPARARRRPRRASSARMTRSAGIGRDAAGLAAASDAVEAATTLAAARDPRRDVEDAALTLARAGRARRGRAPAPRARGCHVRTDSPGHATTSGSASLEHRRARRRRHGRHGR